MNTKNHIYIVLIICFLSFFRTYSQCNLTETLTICDITTIDFDEDGTPDGTINLYDEYFDLTGDNLEPGTWSTSADISITLDQDTGNVSVWNLRESSTDPNLNKYSFQLFNIECGDQPSATVNLVLGAFSGEALPPFGVNNVNVETCEGNFDLFNSLVSSGEVPSAHLNGTWALKNEVNNAEVIWTGLGPGNIQILIDYQPGIPLVDQAILDFTYTVQGNTNCDLQQVTEVRISAVRQVSAGKAESILICEDSIIEGNFDTDIDLRDDQYLSDEDIEGQWEDTSNINSGEIDDGNDSNINIKEIYDDLLTRKGPRFGCESYEFTYKVDKRSGVCDDSEATVHFTLYEEIRPSIQKGEIPQFCANQQSNINLYDLIEFTREDGIEYVYNEDRYVNWRQTSGESNIPIDQARYECSGNGNIIENLHLGTIRFFDVIPGIYTFEYGVSPDINCQAFTKCNPFSFNCDCNKPCDISITEIQIEILPYNYSGEDTANIILCENSGSSNLLSLLESKPEDREIITTGVWTNENDEVIDNNFVFPEIIEDTEYTFTYTTTHPTSGCVDTSTLSFTIVNEHPNPAGQNTLADVCSIYESIRLIDLLEGNPERTGFWTGPDNYVSADFLGEFFFNNQMTPLQEAVYTYTVETKETCIAGNTATLTINFVDPMDIGSDLQLTYCKIQNSVDLLDDLPDVTPKTGTFSEIDTIGTLTGSTVSFETLDPGRYNFNYTISDDGPCLDASITIELTILDEPVAGSAGANNTVRLCANDYNINLFDELGGSPVSTGTWNGPLGFTSTNENALFNVNDTSLIPLLNGGIYTYTVGGGICSTSFDTSIITVEFINEDIIEEDIEQTFCLAENSVDLFSLLAPTSPRTGTFSELDTTDVLTGSTVSFTDLTIGQYNFLYTVPSEGPCSVSTLNIRLTLINETVESFTGEDAVVSVCANSLSLNLFDQLGGDPQPIGTWSGPFGYRSTNHLGTFAVTNPDLPRLAEGVYTYSIDGGVCSTNSDTSTVTIEFVSPIEVDDDISLTRCKSGGSINLFSLLNDSTTRSGIFIELEDTKALAGDGRVDFSSLPEGIYNYQYTVTNESPCDASILNIELQLIDLETPEIPFATFCILDAKRLNDIEVDVLNFNWYESFESKIPIINNPILTDNTTLYLANVDSENCESERIEVPIRILNIGEKVEIKDINDNLVEVLECPLDFQDGVTPNNDNQNDRFELIKENKYNIPEAFPEFQLKIYNRFGTIVFEGNINTEEFKGENNVSLSIGKDLPSGVYFYLFNPNFKNNTPIQGSFYLSK